MSDLHESGQWIRDHPGESIFGEVEHKCEKSGMEGLTWLMVYAACFIFTAVAVYLLSKWGVI